MRKTARYLVVVERDPEEEPDYSDNTKQRTKPSSVRRPTCDLLKELDREINTTVILTLINVNNCYLLT